MKIVDMHCDTISYLLNQKKENKKVSLRCNGASVDVLKMQQGDYLLQVFAAFVCLKKETDPVLHCHNLISLYYELLEENQDLIRPVFTYADIEKNRRENMMSAFLSLEEGALVHGDIAMLAHYHRIGVRMITLTWNYKNGIGYPNVQADTVQAYKDYKLCNTKDGLTPFGIAYIKEMERLHMVIDVSHLSDAGFYDVVKYTTKPFVASHSNARTVCDMARNLSDEMIVKLHACRGVMGINLYGDFLAQSDNGGERSCLEDIVKHISYIKSIVGVDVIALGTDFDGISSSLEVPNAACMPMLVEALRAAAFSEEEIAKICYKNVLRVFKEVLQ